MSKLNEFLKAIDFNLDRSSKFLWNCWPDARYYDATSLNDGTIAYIVYNGKTDTLYNASISIDDETYTYYNQKYFDVYVQEFHNRDLPISNELYKYTDDYHSIFEQIREAYH